MTASIRFERVNIRGFRNIQSLDFEPAPRLNVISGDNGHGKTSVLEAIYAVSTSRSFRAERLAEAIQTGAEAAVVRVQVRDGDLGREQRIALEPSRRSVTMDGKRPAKLAIYATRTPVVVFHPGDLVLVSGPASDRRTLLDRLALFLDPTSGDHRLRYTRATRERQRALLERGTNASDLPAFETLMVQHGTRLQQARRESAEALGAELEPAFRKMAPSTLEFTTSFVPGGSESPEEFARELASRRGQDARRKTASFGPQRDELELLIDGRSARRHASQGQQRLLTLAMKAAELACVRAARRAHPVLLLDDFSSELDPTRTGAVYDFLEGSESQIFVTTTRSDLFPTPAVHSADRVDWTVCDGRLERG